MKKTTYPPDTFIPFKQRLLAIFQLCLALSLLLWYGAQPFMGEYFRVKSHILMHEFILGTSSFLKSEAEKELLERNKIRFITLPQEDQVSILKDYEKYIHYSNRPIIQKIYDAFKTLFYEIPPFELAWIIFSIIISILLLKKHEGAKQASWLLFVIALIYCFNNFFYGLENKKGVDEGLFPNESFLTQNYLNEPLSNNLNEQRRQLISAWDKYLIENWGNKKTVLSHEIQLEEAKFNFTLERIKLFINSQSFFPKMIFHAKIHYLWLLIFICWNLMFSLNMNRLKI